MNKWVFIPGAKGTYILELRLQRAAFIRVGKKGDFAFPPGACYYIGSAFGPGGLAARLSRHLRRPASLRWHIDYLLRAAVISNIWGGPMPHEHRWAEIFETINGAEIPVPGFGASDCRCASHLFHFQSSLPSAFVQQLTGAGIISYRRLK